MQNRVLDRNHQKVATKDPRAQLVPERDLLGDFWPNDDDCDWPDVYLYCNY
jgi:hypothetical protein